MIAGRHSVTANLFALSQAQELAAQGADNREIYHKTGWFVGSDSKWRYEIDDSAARIVTPVGVLEQLRRFAENDDHHYERPDTPLTDYVDHPALYAAYPQLRHVKAGIPYRIDDERALASAQGTGRILYADEASLAEDHLRPTTLHEIQHIIQNLEGFQLGSAPSEWAKRRERRGTEPKMPDDQMYRNTYGEREAENTAHRLDMTMDERAKTPPFGVISGPDARLEIGSGMRVTGGRFWLQFISTVVLTQTGGA